MTQESQGLERPFAGEVEGFSLAWMAAVDVATTECTDSMAEANELFDGLCFEPVVFGWARSIRTFLDGGLGSRVRGRRA